ncbi:DUF2637 domain-containing protein [Streptosporangium canum]|uniref:DUF2637 domain-containing protein n=1 Tax=Streptosporangium canum TaxID=324952 RepID=UPI00343E80F3
MASTYYDPRAQRAVAGAEAERARAEAEAMRMETMLRLDAERRKREREDAEDKRVARAQREEDAAKRRSAQAATMRKGARGLTEALKARSEAIVGAVAMGSPMFIAWGGQLAFGSEQMHLGAAAVTLPIAMEGSVLYTAYLTNQAIDKGLPTGRYRLMTMLMAATAAAMNLWHQVDKAATKAEPWAGLQVGVIYAVASLLGIVLWELRAALKKQAVAKRSAAELRRAAWRRIRYPRLSWSAASIQGAQGCSIDEAWRAAWIDRYGVGPGSSRRDRKLARSIVRYEKKADRAAAKDGRLVIVDGSIVRPGVTPSAQATQEGEEAMARLKAFSAQRADVARSIAFPTIGSPSVESSIERPATLFGPASPDRPASIEGRSTGAPTSIEDGRSTVPDSIVRPRPSIEPRSIDNDPADRSTDPDSDSDSEEPTPRRSIEEHRATLHTAIEAGDIDPQEATAEGIRKFLRCAPKTAQTLRDEIRTEVAA